MLHGAHYEHLVYRNKILLSTNTLCLDALGIRKQFIKNKNKNLNKLKKYKKLYYLKNNEDIAYSFG